MRMIVTTLFPGFLWEWPLQLVEAQVFKLVVILKEYLLLPAVVPLVTVGIFIQRRLSGGLHFPWSQNLNTSDITAVQTSSFIVWGLLNNENKHKNNWFQFMSNKMELKSTSKTFSSYLKISFSY